jgi:hypothetical protein
MADRRCPQASRVCPLFPSTAILLCRNAKRNETCSHSTDLRERATAMDLHEVQAQLTGWLNEATSAFQKVPGSAVLIRYVRSSYQNDPVRSAIELVLVIFFIRYLLAPSYSTSKQNFIKLTEDVSAPRPDEDEGGKKTDAVAL